MSSDSPALYAGFWRRAAALLADGLVVSIFVIPFDFTPLQFAGAWTGFIVSMVVDWAYAAGFHSSRWQATPGKRACGIKVTDLEGRRIGFGRATSRYLASMLSTLILGIGFLMAGWTRRKQALHDKLAGTLVLNEAVRPGDTASASGVMPVTGGLVAGLAASLAASVALPYATWHWTGVGDAKRGNAVASATPAQQERIAYEIYSQPLFADGWRFVSSGVRVYHHGDITARRLPGSEPPYIVKSLSLAEVAFLDDVTLRLARYWFIPFDHGDTDRVVVKKGSVFWLAD